MKMQCPRCHGHGQVDLPEELEELLGVLMALKNPHFEGVTAEGCRFMLNRTITVNAFTNRLKDLCNMGLARRERRGKFFYYFPTVTHKPKKGRDEPTISRPKPEARKTATPRASNGRRGSRSSTKPSSARR